MTGERNPTPSSRATRRFAWSEAILVRLGGGGPRGRRRGARSISRLSGDATAKAPGRSPRLRGPHGPAYERAELPLREDLKGASRPTALGERCLGLRTRTYATSPRSKTSATLRPRPNPDFRRPPEIRRTRRGFSAEGHREAAEREPCPQGRATPGHEATPSSHWPALFTRNRRETFETVPVAGKRSDERRNSIGHTVRRRGASTPAARRTESRQWCGIGRRSRFPRE